MGLLKVTDAEGIEQEIHSLEAGRQALTESAAVALSTPDYTALQAVTTAIQALGVLLGPINADAAADSDADAALGAVLKAILRELMTGLTASGSFTMTGEIPAGDNAIGTVGVTALPPLAAGNANIGDVDVASVPTKGSSTREYGPTSVLQAFTATSSTATSLPTLGVSREVRLDSSAVCWVIFGTSTVGVAAAGATCMRFGINTAEVIQIPAGATHFRVIRETADGNLLLTPVA